MTKNELMQEWLKAKQEEELANKRRLEIENELVELCNPYKDPTEEGTKTEKDNNFICKFSRSNSLSISEDNIQLLQNTNSILAQRVLSCKYAINKSALKTLTPEEDNEIKKYLVVKPSKISVKIEIKGE